MECKNLKNGIDKKAGGIWKFHRFFSKEIEPIDRLTLGEGGTSLESYDLDGKKLWLKREDLNPNGSHKDRSLAYQVSLAKQRGEKELIISSSGNAAISAAAFCQVAGIKLWAFVSPRINRAKFLLIKKLGAKIVLSDRAARLANYLSKKKQIHNLRPSTDDDSIDGFKSIGFELYSQLPQALPIFTFVTSGSSFLGIYEACKQLQERKCGDVLPPLEAVVSKSGDLAGRGGAKRSRRFPAVQAALRETGGEIRDISDDQITWVLAWLHQRKILSSPEGAAAVAAFRQSDYNEAVCIITGRYYPDRDISGGDQKSVTRAAKLADIDKLIV